MKYSHLIISELPKSFDLWDAVEAFQPIYEGMKSADIQYDAYPAECDEEKGEDACFPLGDLDGRFSLKVLMVRQFCSRRIGAFRCRRVGATRCRRIGAFRCRQVAASHSR